MPIARFAIPIALFVVTAVPQVAAAQNVPAVPPVPAEAWTVAPDPARGLVQIGKTAADRSTLFVGGCNRSADAGFIGAFSRYRGGALRTDGQPERVLFEIRGEEWREVFSAQLRYVAGSGAWQIAAPLAPVFVNSFSRGNRFAVLNSRQREVIAFDLTGSSAAARTMREVCGFGTGLPN